MTSREQPDIEQLIALTAFLIARLSEDEQGFIDRAFLSDQPVDTAGLARVHSIQSVVQYVASALRNNIRPGHLDLVLRLLAEPYAGHPDFRDEWS